MKLGTEAKSRLAGEYVLGTQTWRVRARIAWLARADRVLRAAITHWEQLLAPLADDISEVQPPPRVWKAIEARIDPRRAGAAVSARLPWWRFAAFASAACAALLALAMLSEPSSIAPINTVAVLADPQHQAGLIVTWPPLDEPRDRYLQIKVLAQTRAPAGKSWQLWMLPTPTAAPVSLGVLGPGEQQLLPLDAASSGLLPRVWGLAISVEPAGGSPTGKPTGPVIYSGPAFKLS